MGEQLRLSDGDIVARCAIDPQFRPQNERSGPFDEKRLFYFQQGKENRRVHQLSVGWRALLPTDPEVHAYGCRTAATTNRRKEQKTGQPPKPLEEAAHYIGYYDIPVKGARSAANEVYDVVITNVVEENEPSHCNFELIERDGIDRNTPKSEYKTRIVIALWKLATGPSRHVCECDLDYAPALSAIELPHRP